MPPRAKPRSTTTGAKSNGRAPKAAEKPSPQRPVTIRVEELSDANEYKNILVVGDSGVGKTVLVGGAPNGIFLSTEKGTISAKRQGSKAKLIRVNTWMELEAGLEYIEENSAKYGWVMVDSLPKMQRLLRRYLLDVNMEEQRKGADPDSLQIQDYDKWYNMFIRFYDRLIDMDINTIFTSTPMRVETEDDEGDPIDIVLPAIQGKAKEGYAIAQYVCAEVDCLWYLNMERRKGRNSRVLLTQKRPPFFAKDRFAALPARVVLPENDPTLMSRLLAKLDSGEVVREDQPEPDDVEDAEDEDVEEDAGDEPEEDDAPSPRRKPRKAPEKRPAPRKRPKKAEPEEDEDDIDLDEEDDDNDDYDNE